MLMLVLMLSCSHNAVRGHARYIETLSNRFHPRASVTPDASKRLFGTTEGGDTVCLGEGAWSIMIATPTQQALRS